MGSKEFLIIRIELFIFSTHYSNIPSFQGDGIYRITSPLETLRLNGGPVKG
jgi:hypothetical protein